MEEWKEYKLGEISDIQTGPFGSQLHQKDYVPLGTPCIMPTSIGNRLNIDTTNIAHVKGEDVTRLQRHCVKEGDIIYSRRGDIEKCAYILPVNEGWLCGTGCLRIRVKDNDVNSRFVAYQLSTCECKKWIVGNAVGSTMLNLNTSILKELPLRLPSKNEQDRLVNILKSLDDKIEVNRRINDNLEQQAQALFKSWFVDFEPFRDQPFVESELGMIPEGWRVMLFKDVCETITDGVHNTVKDDINGKYFLLSCKNIKGGQISIGNSERKINREVFEKLRKRTNLQKGDILLSSVGTIGEIVLLNESPYNYEFQRSVAMIKPNTNLISPHFLYYSMKVQKDNIIHSAHGAVQQCLFISDIANFKTICPPYNIIQLFTNIVFGLHDMISKNREESRRLVQLRDTLLPRLMSGEIKVENVTL